MSLKSRVVKKIKYVRFKGKSLFITFTILTIFSIYLSLSLSYPPVADGATFADIVRQISQTNQIHSTQPYVLATPEMNMPLFYPQLFFVLVAILNLSIGQISLNLIHPLSNVLLILSLYIFVRYLSNKKVAILASIISIGSYYLMSLSTKMEQEPTLFFLMISFIYCFCRLVNSRNKNWIFVSSIILAGAIGIKQQAVFLLIFIIVVLILHLIIKDWKSYKHVILNSLIMLCLAGVIVSPVLFYQFSTTGTIFYPGGTPQPIIQIEKKLAEDFGVQQYPLNPKWLEYTMGTRWGLSRIESTSPIGIIDNLNSFNTLKTKSAHRLFFIVFLILGMIRILKKIQLETVATLLLILIMIAMYAFLIPIWDYFIITNVLASFILALGISTVLDSSKLTNTKIVPLILMCLVVVIVTSAGESYHTLQHESVQINRNMEEFEKMGAWIKNNVPANEIIITSRITEVSYRSDRKTIWLNLIDGTDIYEDFNSGNESRLINTMVKYDISYVLISNWWTGDPKVWFNFMSSKGAQMIKESDYFEEAYHTERVSLYKLKVT